MMFKDELERDNALLTDHYKRLQDAAYKAWRKLEVSNVNEARTILRAALEGGLEL